jgi:hypothetical protein
LKNGRFELKIARFESRIAKFELKIDRFEVRIDRFELKTARFKPSDNNRPNLLRGETALLCSQKGFITSHKKIRSP